MYATAWTVYYEYTQAKRHIVATCRHKHKTVTACLKCYNKIAKAQANNNLMPPYIGKVE